MASAIKGHLELHAYPLLGSRENVPIKLRTFEEVDDPPCEFNIAENRANAKPIPSEVSR